MKLFEDLSAKAIAAAVSALSGIMAAGCAFLSVIFVSAKLLKSEMSYGLPLAIGPPIAIITGIVVFVVVFRKMRSLAK